MTIEKTIHIDADSDRVWDVLALQFHDAHKWASSVDHSEAAEGHEGACEVPWEASGRRCETSLGQVYETMLHFDADKRTFGYDANLASAPFFVKQIVNNWHVQDGPDGSTEVTMKLEGTLLPVFSQLMGPAMKKQFNGFLTEATEELKYYIEEGRPHPRKLAKLAVAA